MATRTEQGSAIDLRGAVGAFFSHPSPWILVPVVVAAAAARVALGKWGWGDVAIPIAILGLEPFTEWIVHVVVLHFRPRTVLGRQVDLYVARKHREHHRDPRNLPLVFIPLRVLVVSIIAGSAGWWLLSPLHRSALTGIAASFAMMTLYEWTHFLIHSTYRPKSRLYRYVWRAHRLHHYRNERYWFGVTVHVADHLLGTFPEKDAVPLSPTARTLGIESA